MADPIIEKLALQVLSEVSNVTEANGYNITLSDVVRETRIGHNPRHLLAVIRQDYEDEAGIEQGNPAIITIPVVWLVTVYVLNSDRDQTAIDRLMNIACADVTKAVTANWNVKTADTIGGLAYNWELLSPQAFESGDGAYNMIVCRYRSMVRVNENDPYTQR